MLPPEGAPKALACSMGLGLGTRGSIGNSVQSQFSSTEPTNQPIRITESADTPLLQPTILMHPERRASEQKDSVISCKTGMHFPCRGDAGMVNILILSTCRMPLSSRFTCCCRTNFICRTPRHQSLSGQRCLGRQMTTTTSTAIIMVTTTTRTVVPMVGS